MERSAVVLLGVDEKPLLESKEFAILSECATRPLFGT